MCANQHLGEKLSNAVLNISTIETSFQVATSYGRDKKKK